MYTTNNIYMIIILCVEILWTIAIVYNYKYFYLLKNHFCSFIILFVLLNKHEWVTLYNPIPNDLTFGNTVSKIFVEYQRKPIITVWLSPKYFPMSSNL